MTFEAVDRRRIREWVGDDVHDADIDVVGEDTSYSVPGTALSILRTRRATILAAPADWGSDGYSEAWQANIAQLNADIRKLEAEVAIEDDATDPTLVGDGPMLEPAQFRVPRERLFNRVTTLPRSIDQATDDTVW